MRLQRGKTDRDVHDSDDQQRVSDQREIIETVCEDPECTKEEIDKNVDDCRGAEMEDDDHCRRELASKEGGTDAETNL